MTLLFGHSPQSVLEKLDDPAVMRECSLRMVQCKALKRLELLSQKDISHDPEMTEDLKFLQVRVPRSLPFYLLTNRINQTTFLPS